MTRAYLYHHVVGFAETNLTGNVYFTHHLAWHGRCRELFLRDHAPEVLQQLARELTLVTVRCSCEYLSELVAGDEVTVEMRLVELVQNRVRMRFDTYVERAEVRTLAARGEQEIACMRRTPGGLVPIPVPSALRTALEAFQERGAARKA
jgi:enediyne biosynthesis thioesterase